MNKKQEILEKIKKLMFGDSTNNFLDIVANEKNLRINGDEIAVDTTVSSIEGDVVTDITDDTLDGDYVYDSVSFTIVNGVITEVSEVEADETETETETETQNENENEVEEEMEAVEETKPETTPEFNYVTEVQTLINRVTVYEEQIAEMRTIQENFLSVLEEFISDTPADKKTKTKNFKNHNVIKNNSNTLENLRNIRKKTK